MMEKKEIIFIVIILLMVIAFLVYNYVFNIYEVNYEVSTKEIFADNQFVVKINVFPVNGLGFKAPLRKLDVKFYITEGKELIDIVKLDEEYGQIILKAKNQTGKVVIKFKSKYSLFPSVVEINILPNFV